MRLYEYSKADDTVEPPTPITYLGFSARRTGDDLTSGDGGNHDGRSLNNDSQDTPPTSHIPIVNRSQRASTIIPSETVQPPEILKQLSRPPVWNFPAHQFEMFPTHEFGTIICVTATITNAYESSPEHSHTSLNDILMVSQVDYWGGQSKILPTRT